MPVIVCDPKPLLDPIRFVWFTHPRPCRKQEMQTVSVAPALSVACNENARTPSQFLRHGKGTSYRDQAGNRTGCQSIVGLRSNDFDATRRALVALPAV